MPPALHVSLAVALLLTVSSCAGQHDAGSAHAAQQAASYDGAAPQLPEWQPGEVQEGDYAPTRADMPAVVFAHRQSERMRQQYKRRKEAQRVAAAAGQGAGGDAAAGGPLFDGAGMPLTGPTGATGQAGPAGQTGAAGLRPRVPVAAVAAMTLAMALASGLGALPFFFTGALSKPWAGTANAVGSGVMLAASFGLVAEGTPHGGGLVVAGLLAGAAFIKLSQTYLEQYEVEGFEELKGAEARKVILFLAVMAAHAVGEGSGVGVSFSGARGWAQGTSVTLAIGLHNVPEGLAVATVMAAKGTPPGRALQWCILTALPQALVAVPAYLFVETFTALLPLAMGFAAGSMMWIVVAELLPDALESLPSHQVATTTTVAAAWLVALSSYINSLENASSSMSAAPALLPLAAHLLPPCLVSGFMAGIVAHFLPSKPAALGLAAGVLSVLGAAGLLGAAAGGAASAGWALVLAPLGAAAARAAWQQLARGGAGGSSGRWGRVHSGSGGSKKGDDPEPAAAAAAHSYHGWVPQPPGQPLPPQHQQANGHAAPLAHGGPYAGYANGSGANGSSTYPHLGGHAQQQHPAQPHWQPGTPPQQWPPGVGNPPAVAPAGAADAQPGSPHLMQRSKGVHDPMQGGLLGGIFAGDGIGDASGALLPTRQGSLLPVGGRGAGGALRLLLLGGGAVVLYGIGSGLQVAHVVLQRPDDFSALILPCMLTGVLLGMMSAGVVGPVVGGNVRRVAAVSSLMGGAGPVTAVVVSALAGSGLETLAPQVQAFAAGFALFTGALLLWPTARDWGHRKATIGGSLGAAAALALTGLAGLLCLSTPYCLTVRDAELA